MLVQVPHRAQLWRELDMHIRMGCNGVDIANMSWADECAVLQRAARSNDATPVKQRPQARAQPICPPNASAKGFTMGRGRALTPSGQSFQQAHVHAALHVSQILERQGWFLMHTCSTSYCRRGQASIMACSFRLGSTHFSSFVMSVDMNGLGNIEEEYCACAEQAKAPGSEPAPVAAEASVPSQMLNGVAGEAAAPASEAVPAAASLGDAPPDSGEDEEAARDAQAQSASLHAVEAFAPTPAAQSAPEV